MLTSMTGNFRSPLVIFSLLCRYPSLAPLFFKSLARTLCTRNPSPATQAASPPLPIHPFTGRLAQRRRRPYVRGGKSGRRRIGNLYFAAEQAIKVTFVQGDELLNGSLARSLSVQKVVHTPTSHADFSGL